MNTKSMHEERGASYGSFDRMSEMAQRMKEIACYNSDMSNVQKEAMQLICTKIARIANGDCNCRDSWADIAGYANLVVLDLDRPKPEEYNRVLGAGLGQMVPQEHIDKRIYDEQRQDGRTKSAGLVPTPRQHG